MDALNYSNVVSHLFRRLPEFVQYEPAPEPDLPHDVFGSFALFICEAMSKGASVDLVERAFGLLSDMASSSDEDVRNLLVVSVFEVIADNESCRDAAMRHLSDEGRVLLERTLQGWKPEA